MNWKYFVLIWTCTPALIFGQQDSYRKKIIGLVLAEDNGQPLAFAHLSVGGNEIGTLTNKQGLFVLKIPLRLQKDSLRATYLGYAPHTLAIQDIENDTVLIHLKTQDFRLETIDIPSISPIDTIKKAWRRREENYEIRPTMLRGFYREEMEDTLADIQFLFAEGVLELYKSPYNKLSLDKVRVLKGRKKKLPDGYVIKGKEYLLPQITQGPHLGILLDVMKDEDSFIRRNKHRLYDYSFEEVIYHNNRLTYVFSFSPKNPSKTSSIYQGKIYLDLEKLAVVHANYEFTPAGIQLYNRISKNLHLYTRSFDVNYMEFEGKWYLQDAQVSNQYLFPTAGSVLHSRHTFLTTEILDEQIRSFTPHESFSLNDAFVDVVDVLDEKFWEEYNILHVEKH